MKKIVILLISCIIFFSCSYNINQKETISFNESSKVDKLNNSSDEFIESAQQEVIKEKTEIEYPEWYTEEFVEKVRYHLENPKLEDVSPKKIVLMKIEGTLIPVLLLGFSGHGCYGTVYYAYDVNSFETIETISNDIELDDYYSYSQPEGSFITDRNYTLLFSGKEYYEGTPQVTNYYTSSVVIGRFDGIYLISRVWQDEQKQWYSENRLFHRNDTIEMPVSQGNVKISSCSVRWDMTDFEEALEKCVRDYIKVN